jgi:hypothetical protein
MAKKGKKDFAGRSSCGFVAVRFTIRGQRAVMATDYAPVERRVQ